MQTLKVVNGYPIVDSDSRGGPAKMVPTSAAPAEAPVEAPAETPAQEDTAAPRVPAWVAYDRKVLRFYAYFREAVNESRAEHYRIRKCVIYFYLEDESIHVAEPKQENSGIPQGVFIKRHQIPKGDGAAEGNFGVQDLLIGEVVNFYGRSLHIIDCDPFTRSFLADNGLEAGEPIGLPSEPIEKYRKSLQKVKSGAPPKPRDDDLTRYMEAKLGRASNVLLPDKLHQFIENDRKVLRFFCLHDDRDRLYGDRRPYVLHYFLADDTVEILEAYEPNSGRDPFPVFLKRCKLPKGRVSMDMTLQASTEGTVTMADLGIGKTIDVYNRTFLLHDCDEFTRTYLKIQGGERIDISLPQMEEMTLDNGSEYGAFGVDGNDAQQNSTSLIPKPPKKDFHKLMNNEKKVLRFITGLVEGAGQTLSYADKDRTFILSYFLADDTIAIFEPPARNSGIIGGKFLERCTIKKPGSKQAYKEGDLHVGAVLAVHNRHFQLKEADEYTLRYMEDNKDTFTFSDASAQDKALRIALAAGGEEVVDSFRGALIEMDQDGTGDMTAEALDDAFRAIGINLKRQQLVTFVRKHGSEGSVSCEMVIGMLCG